MLVHLNREDLHSKVSDLTPQEEHLSGDSRLIPDKRRMISLLVVHARCFV